MPKTSVDPEVNLVGVLFLLMIIDGAIWNNFANLRVIAGAFGIGLAMASSSRSWVQRKSRGSGAPVPYRRVSLMASIGCFCYFIGALVYAVYVT
ncbi:hypothetical protein AWB64_04816 [Caballeronia sordidicola]|uniref:Uncharacterized protein n=1 Tax=Caballeronia sordidicola TaxID=196367 RepID=A0A158HMU7_CABSO|nr:hypothetical protein [Caballeronia sordidicola]SAL45596.1 hypothetical protein AWB64_04816 [Caballeronia sordidicola]